MTTEQKFIKTKVGISGLTRHLDHVSKASQVTGYSWDSFYLFKELCDTGGNVALQEIFPQKLLLMDRTTPNVEQAIYKWPLSNPPVANSTWRTNSENEP